MTTAKQIRSLCASVRGARHAGAIELAQVRERELRKAVASARTFVKVLEQRAGESTLVQDGMEFMRYGMYRGMQEAIKEAESVLNDGANST